MTRRYTSLGDTLGVDSQKFLDVNPKELYTLSHHRSVVSCEWIFAEMESKTERDTDGQTDRQKDLCGA